jgi:hypothetical protein
MSFWADIFPPVREWGCYYTYPSFYLFLLALLMPGEHRLKWILLLNSLVVGLLGNAVYWAYYERNGGDLRDLFPGMTQEEATRSAFRTNLAHHTIPLAVSLFLFLRGPPQRSEDLMAYLGAMVVLWIAWLMVPYNGRDGGRKITTSYPSVKLYQIVFVWAAAAGIYAAVSK